MTVAPDLTASYPRAWPTRLSVTLRDGTEVRGASDFPVGNPENPVSTAQLEEKFTGLVAPRWGDDAAERAIEIVHALESFDDMSKVFLSFAHELAAAIR